MVNRCFVVMAALLLLSLCACSGASTGGIEGASTQSPEGSGLPKLAHLDALKGSSVSSTELRLGREGIAESVAAEEQGTSLVLNAPTNGSLQWAVYRFDLPRFHDQLDSLDLALSLDAGEGCLLALADYAGGKWSILGQISSAGNFVIPGGEFISPAERCYCAIITPPGDRVKIDSLTLHSSDPDNNAPVAVLESDVNSGNLPLTVNFDASGSTAGDAGDEISRYLWDFEGDGLNDLETTVPVTSHVYGGGDFKPTVTVEDSFDVQASASVDVAVTQLAQTIDADGEAGGYSSLAIVNGKPAISYFEAGNGDLRYVRALDALGGGWGAPLTLDSSGITGEFSSLAVVDGFPAVSYINETDGQLCFIRALDADGTAWGTPVKFDDGLYSASSFSSLKIIAGQPAIAYGRTTNFIGFYVAFRRANDASGTDWGPGQELGLATNQVPLYGALAEVSGRPAVAFMAADSFETKELHYVRAADSTGAAWPFPQTVAGTPESLDQPGEYCSLAVINGRPAISYSDMAYGALCYVRANDADGVAWATPQILDGGAGPATIFWYTSLAEVNGRPAISYLDGQNADLKYVAGLDADGATWGQAFPLDSAGDTGVTSSLIDLNGQAAVSYYDYPDGDIFDPPALRFITGF